MVRRDARAADGGRSSGAGASRLFSRASAPRSAFDPVRHMPGRRARVTPSVRVATIALCALFGLLAWSATGLAAAPTPDPTNPTFDGSTTPDNSFGNNKVAVDESTGDVYVVDDAHGLIDRFSSTGTYLSQITGSFSLGGEDDIAVDNSGGPTQGRVYLISESANTLFAYDASGAPLWQSSGFGDACGVGVDSTGHPWVADYSTSATSQLNPLDGTSTGTSITTNSQGCELAFSPSDDLYSNVYHTAVDKYSAGGSFVATVDSTFTFDVATDTSTGEVYTERGFEVAVFDSTGTLVPGTPFDQSSTQLAGVTVDGKHGRVYVSDSANADVQIFLRAGGSGPFPYVRTGAATGIGAATATLNAKVNPAGVSTACHFEYGTTTSYGSSAPCSSAPGSGSSDVDVDAALSGLSGGTTYHYRIVATNANGTTNGSDQTLNTVAPQHTLTVTLGGSGSGTVTSSPAGISCPGTCASLFNEGHVILTATPAAHSSFAGWVGGVCSGTSTCDVDLTADTTVGATFSHDKPTVGGEAATGVTQTAATLSGTVNPNGAATTCTIEWGLTTAYGTTVPCSAAPGSGAAAVPVTIPALSGLAPATTYHYRIDANNVGGTTNGGDKTFTTLAVPLPSVVTGAPSGVTQTAASVAGTVNPNGFSSTCQFQYGTTTAYGSTAACGSAPGSGSSAVAVSATLSGLTPGTTYHYRLVGTNAGGSANGSDQTFTTSAVTPPTCAIDASLCPDLVLITRSATVSRSSVALKVSCVGTAGGSCKGILKLTAKVKQGKKTKTIRVGQASVNLLAGKGATLKVKLTSAAKKILAKKHVLKASATGLGVKKTITIKQPAKKKKKH